jgi:hypothetical protein
MGNNKNGALQSYPLAPPFSYSCGQNMNYEAEETKQDYEKSDDEDDLKRFLQGGFGAK